MFNLIRNITIHIPRDILIINESGEKMKTIICLLILCLTCIIIVKMCLSDKMHDLVIKIGKFIYIKIRK